MSLEWLVLALALAIVGNCTAGSVIAGNEVLDRLRERRTWRLRG